ncbi:AMP-binding protein [Bradyrhizobium arachidis]|uniref:Cyclohexanecarboxylate-CoA ligase n=1 Tax=Bradyrhizobium arachidis TaxID=858423 RepID=A0AAE7NV77_9BRAD|nr:AMP-binding protein [Bradyrhizobium arachidis]QOZ70996.1 cyclohexanecarboxylate-CoA ligase [Bradyrhizobium arachidis]SFV17737.1 cyclohexanecarboxylate-CoA ligase [Bradyrhizobium arachidis]
MIVVAALRDTSHANFRQAGYWLDKTVDQLLTEAVARAPDKVAMVADRADRDQAPRFTYRELDDLANRAASSLLRLGVGRGDVVTVQLPNWWEFVVTAFACSKIGAVMNPVMPILRERELVYILNFCQAKVFIVPKRYRGFDYAAMAQGMRAELPHLKHVIVADGEGETGFERMLLSADAGELPAGLRPDDMAVLMFTSGTTGEPKGVMHTSNSLIACCKALSGRFGLDSSDVLLVASPVGHMTGYAAIVLLSVYLGGTMILQDIWEAKRGVGLMAREGVTYTAASTPFLSDICEAVKGGSPQPKSLRSFLCGGAPIPSALIERAAGELGLKVCSLWGMTEVLSGTLTEPSRAADKSASTDGRSLEGMEVRIVDTEGNPVPAGEPGRLLVRGAQMFKGYYKRPELPTFDGDGWFDSGDLAYMDKDGYIRISGRVKDILIRGGENVPVVEIENLLYKHPAVSAVAVVGFPDARLGERGCAFIVPRSGSTIDLTAVQAYLGEARMAKQFWPERIELVAELPRTASGKIQKFRLRELAAAFAEAK